MRNATLVRGLAAASLVTAIGASPAVADLAVFHSIDNFLLEGPSNLQRDDLGSLAVDNVMQQHSSLTLGGMTLSTNNNSLSVWDTSLGNAFATYGDQYIHVASDAMAVTFSFVVPVTTFGLHISDWGEFGSGTLWYTDDLGNHEVIATTPLPDGNLMFFGIESVAGISQITIHRDNIADGFGLDNIFYQTIPAPGALALLGLAGLVGIRRRRA